MAKKEEDLEKEINKILIKKSFLHLMTKSVIFKKKYK